MTFLLWTFCAETFDPPVMLDTQTLLAENDICCRLRKNENNQYDNLREVSPLS